MRTTWLERDETLDAVEVTILNCGPGVSYAPKLERVEWLTMSMRAQLVAPNLKYIGDYTLPTPDEAKQRMLDIAHIVVPDPTLLDMEHWHNECGTVHCIAGWALTLAGETGQELENHFHRDTNIAGVILLGIEAFPLFYRSNDEALEYLRTLLKDNPPQE
jgi:hypothetical protein